MSNSRTLTATAVLAAVLTVTACGGSDGAEAGAPRTTTAGITIDPSLTAVPMPPACAEIFRPGHIIDDALARGGCTDPDGTIRGIGSFRCGDGRHLYQVDASTGAPAGWGFGGEAYKANKDAANDSAYGKAYDTCNG